MGASESKLAFKQSIFQLASRPDIPHHDPLWPQFYSLPESVNDVFSLWSPNDVGCLTLSNSDNHPPSNAQVSPNKNLETLIYILVARLQSLHSTLVYPDDHRTTTVEILNCMRILTRLIPFIYEAPHLKEWHDRFFWEKQKPTYFWDNKLNKPGQLFNGLHPSTTYPVEDFDQEIGPPLGETLIDLVVKYLFFSGFSVPSRFDADGKPDLEFVVKVWQTGIGNSRSLGCTKENERNQQEVVRLLLAIMSKPLYISPAEIVTTDVRALTHVTTKLEKRVVNGILCSLLNTVFKYNPNLWSAPLEVATGSADAKKLLVVNCLQLALVLMIYNPPSPLKNQFRQSMSSLHRADDFQFIQQGMTQVLAQPVSGTFNNPLSKDKAVPWAPEMIAFLWEFLQCNRRFRRYLIDTNGALDHVILILFYAIESKDDPAKHGVLRMCVFCLQTMSTEEKFSEKLNTIFRHSETLPAIMRISNFHGSYADFMICSVHSIFATTRSRLESVQPALLAVIRNIAPQQRDLARATSSKLISLLEILSKHDFLLANETNHDMLVGLLVAMNDILESHINENRRFVEILVANRSRFQALRDFTVEGALIELDRQAQERKDRGVDAQSPTSRTGSLEASRTRASSPPSGRSIREDDRFSIGDDEEDDALSHPDDDRSSVDGVAVGSTRQILSEKARGKQPAVMSSALGSHHPSTTSLASLTLNPSNLARGQFMPSPEWLEDWFPRQQLDNILRAIHLAETKQLRFREDISRTKAGTMDTPVQMRTDEWTAGKAQGRMTSMSIQSRANQGIESQPPSNARPGIGFEWSPVAIGWFTALIWSRVYLSEAEALQGSGGLYSSTRVLLFKRSSLGQEISLRSPRGAIDAVGDGLVKRISSIGMK